MLTILLVAVIILHERITESASINTSLNHGNFILATQHSVSGKFKKGKVYLP